MRNFTKPEMKMQKFIIQYSVQFAARYSITVHRNGNINRNTRREHFAMFQLQKVDLRREVIRNRNKSDF